MKAALILAAGTAVLVACPSASAGSPSLAVKGKPGEQKVGGNTMKISGGTKRRTFSGGLLGPGGRASGSWTC